MALRQAAVEEVPTRQRIDHPLTPGPAVTCLARRASGDQTGQLGHEFLQVVEPVQVCHHTVVIDVDVAMNQDIAEADRLGDVAG